MSELEGQMLLILLLKNFKVCISRLAWDRLSVCFLEPVPGYQQIICKHVIKTKLSPDCVLSDQPLYQTVPPLKGFVFLSIRVDIFVYKEHKFVFLGLM